MPAIKVILDGDSCWPDLVEKKHIWIGNEGGAIEIAALPRGMEKGRTSLAIRINLPNGNVIVAETSLALLQGANLAFTTRYGNQIDG